MRELSCKSCGRTKIVSDDYEYRQCVECHNKAVRYRANKQAVKRIEESLENLDVSRLPLMLHSIGAFQKAYEEQFHRKLKKAELYDKYLQAIQILKKRENDARSKAEIKQTNQERKEEKAFLESAFPLVSEDCRRFRLIFIRNNLEDFDGHMWAESHFCDNCLRWRVAYRHWLEEQPAKEGDDSAFDKPITGANPFEEGEPEEKNEENKPLDRDVERSEFDDKNQDHRKVKKKENPDD